MVVVFSSTTIHLLWRRVLSSDCRLAMSSAATAVNMRNYDHVNLALEFVILICEAGRSAGTDFLRIIGEMKLILIHRRLRKTSYF